MKIYRAIKREYKKLRSLGFDHKWSQSEANSTVKNWELDKMICESFDEDWIPRPY